MSNPVHWSATFTGHGAERRPQTGWQWLRAWWHWPAERDQGRAKAPDEPPIEVFENN